MSGCVYDRGSSGGFSAKIYLITSEIWTDCMEMLQGTVDSRKTTTRYADHALPFETIRQRKQNLKWTQGHPENHKDKTRAEWPKEDWGNNLADRLASRSNSTGAEEGDSHHDKCEGCHS